MKNKTQNIQTLNKATTEWTSGQNIQIIFLLLRKTQFIDFVLYPSPNVHSNTVEPFNAVLNINECLNESLRICFDNQALYDMIPPQSSPSFRHVNCYISQIALQTSGFKFKGENSNCGHDGLMTNLIPFPLMNHVIPGYASESSNETQNMVKNLTYDVTFFLFL